MGHPARDLEVFRKVALAIGESLESVCSMQEKERKELIEVLGFKVEAQLEIPDSDGDDETSKDKTCLDDSDDEPLKDNHDNDNIFIDSEDEALVEALAASRKSAAAAIEIEDNDDDDDEEESMRSGWGECPMCRVVVQHATAWCPTWSSTSTGRPAGRRATPRGEWLPRWKTEKESMARMLQISPLCLRSN